MSAVFFNTSPNTSPCFIYCFKRIQTPVTARVSVFQRIVHYITVSIVTLCVVRGLNIWIRTEESSNLWVIYSTIHMNKAHFINVFVSSEAPVGECWDDGEQWVAGAPVAFASLSEGGVCHAFNDKIASFYCGAIL
ncbi:hypothetical protein BAZSYMA_ACONTIG53957_2 [Bathymodiolus azoricus thioautotrophic gill symbiont]|uniref:Uncharacterized protein n=1 Tax=Bathymodiolus azoricus thioautotrophic gill symbiont TaxID=235205 RepID=A0A1H6MW52_9GAMM|nr:hypothetical protein BAZSYMA_ACONTIG53957_2 [Bathymodiolus azoricus thioautotrophic gill symbiont]